MAKQFEMIYSLFRNNFTNISTSSEDTNSCHQHQMTPVLYNDQHIAVMGSKHVDKKAVVGCLKKWLREERNVNINRKKKAISHSQSTSVKIETMDSDISILNPFKNSFIRNANVFVLIYDVSDMASFEHISRLRHDIVKVKGLDEVPLIVLGNKTDKAERKVHPVMADCVVSMDWEALHFEISANDKSKLYEILQHFLKQRVLNNTKRCCSRMY